MWRSLFTLKDKQEISKLIAYELVKNEKDFVWEINDKGLLVLKNEKNKKQISEEEQAYINKIKQSFLNGSSIKKEEIKEKNIFEQVAALFPWEFLKVNENTKVNEDYMQPKFEELKNNDAFITFGYSTNESIKDKKDAIAGVTYISDDSITVSWQQKKAYLLVFMNNTFNLLIIN